MLSAPSEEAARSQAGWLPCPTLTPQTWGELQPALERGLIRRHPELRGKYAAWFKPLEWVAALEKDRCLRLLLRCSTRHRLREVEKMGPLVEEVLAAEIFDQRPVSLMLILAETHTPEPAAGPACPPPPPPPPTPAPAHWVEADPLAQSTRAYYRQHMGIELSPADLAGLLAGLKQPPPLAAAPKPAAPPPPEPAPSLPPAPPAAPRPPAPARIALEPGYATFYDEIVRGHSAVYLPAYFVRHLRHMGASDGLRYLALRQIAYKNGLKDQSGARSLPATLTEMARWSTLSLRALPGNLDNPHSYLFRLAGKTSFLSHWQALPAAAKWEDAAGYHWKAREREYILWKKDGLPGSECSQRVSDPKTQQAAWRQAPNLYRLQLSMPLCPEDAQTLRQKLQDFGVATDPLAAIARCLACPRDEILPDRPQPLAQLPPKLFTVQELVLETWGQTDRALAAQVAVQAKLLEDHLVRPRDLLKIPFYLLEKWGPYLSPAQLWTLILLMDRVYADSAQGEYRDTTTIPRGIKEMTLWTEDEYQKGTARKIGKWLHPYHQAPQAAAEAGTCFNPWFSVFAAELPPAPGQRTKNADQSVSTRLRVLPLVPLAPADTLRFAHHMGLTRLLLQDAAGARLGLELTADELRVYAAGGRALRFSHSGKLLSGSGATQLHALDRDLAGLELLSDESFYQEEDWARALLCRLEAPAEALLCRLETRPGAHSCGLENAAGALLCSLALEPEALFCMLLKLLILNLYGIKQNSQPHQTPSSLPLAENVDPLEHFDGSRQGQAMHWMEIFSDSDWDFAAMVKSLGVTDVKSLKEAGVSAQALAACALELYATPPEKFTAGRISVLVARLRKNPQPGPGPYQRLAQLGPELIQTYLRRAIASWSAAVTDPDWAATLGQARRADLIELAEKLALGRVVRAET